ncbi:hypothetical protein Pla144_02800 [Bythopirellula polymerisocia]|uniref:Uncharacterized protein n=1 Tax=Bythopirellula polymerisocia TaxID=2528003 RepID=A0A5C6CY14_9BACT|nr:hypothetical protein Pla144_02800 [Bythopirellula polymerisocia]
MPNPSSGEFARRVPREAERVEVPYFSSFVRSRPSRVLVTVAENQPPCCRRSTLVKGLMACVTPPYLQLES